jgi:hypothetical protein
MSDVLTARDFVAHVGKTVTPKGQHRVLTIVSVDTSKWPGWDPMRREPFTVTLRGPPDDVLPEGSYEAVVQDGPEFTLYIAPIHTVARDRQNYQVAFN